MLYCGFYYQIDLVLFKNQLNSFYILEKENWNRSISVLLVKSYAFVKCHWCYREDDKKWDMTILFKELIWLGGWNIYMQESAAWVIHIFIMGFFKTKNILLIKKKHKWNFCSEGTLFSEKCHSTYVDVFTLLWCGSCLLWALIMLVMCSSFAVCPCLALCLFPMMENDGNNQSNKKEDTFWCQNAWFLHLKAFLGCSVL